jgi:protein gp37
VGDLTKIEWTRYTFNPWWGCVKVSPGCDHCYAEREAVRYGHHVWGPDSPRRELSFDYWQKPLKWNRLADGAGTTESVFCGSHCDVMEDGEYLQRIRVHSLYPLISRTPSLTWLMLTKRPQNFPKYLPAACLTAASGTRFRSHDSA